MKFRSLIKGFHHDWRVDRILQLLFKRLWYFKYGLLSLVLVIALRAEVLWVLSVVINHFSLCLCLGLNDLFKSMFPDSETAKWIILVSKTKCECLINCGLVSFFKDDLLKLINEMCLHIVWYCMMRAWGRFSRMGRWTYKWDIGMTMRQVCPRYFDSKLLNCLNATNLNTALSASLVKLSQVKSSQTLFLT